MLLVFHSSFFSKAAIVPIAMNSKQLFYRHIFSSCVWYKASRNSNFRPRCQCTHMYTSTEFIYVAFSLHAYYKLQHWSLNWGYIWDSPNIFNHNIFPVVWLLLLLLLIMNGWCWDWEYTVICCNAMINSSREALTGCFLSVVMDIFMLKKITVCYLSLPCWHIIVLQDSHFWPERMWLSMFEDLSLILSTTKQES